jgi:hypothetical protein
MSVHKKAYLMISIFALASALSILSSCGYLNPLLGLRNDNVIEEIAEDAIELSSGEKVDLSAEKPARCPDTIGVIPEQK